MKVFTAPLVYFFHPSVKHINGQAIANTVSRFAALPVLLTVMSFTAILVFLAFLGVGMVIFMAALVFMLLGTFIAAPYFWPMLAIIFPVVLVKYIDSKKNSL